MSDNTPRGLTAPCHAIVRVHPEHCQGHARCREFLPELLVQDGYGPVQLTGDGAIPSPLLERARLAVACCPEMAIELLHE
jgi:ferredoxin